MFIMALVIKNAQVEKSEQSLKNLGNSTYSDADVERADELLRVLHNPYTTDEAMNAAHHEWCCWYRIMSAEFKRYAEDRYAAHYEQTHGEVL